MNGCLIEGSDVKWLDALDGKALPSQSDGARRAGLRKQRTPGGHAGVAENIRLRPLWRSLGRWRIAQLEDVLATKAWASDRNVHGFGTLFALRFRLESVR